MTVTVNADVDDFTPRQMQNLAAYQPWPSVTESFPLNSVGIVTVRDGFAIAFDQEHPGLAR